MPLEDYLELMKRQNIIINPINSCSLAMGKIVMGGAEQESLMSLDVASSPVPVINLEPSVQSITEKIENLLERRKRISTSGL